SVLKQPANFVLEITLRKLLPKPWENCEIEFGQKLVRAWRAKSQRVRRNSDRLDAESGQRLNRSISLVQQKRRQGLVHKGDVRCTAGVPSRNISFVKKRQSLA